MTKLDLPIPEVLDHAMLWARMRELLDRLVTTLDRASFVDDCLDAVVDLLGADRGLVVLGDDGSAHQQAVNARAQGRALSATEREEVSKTVMDEARRTLGTVVWEPHRHGLAVESMADLGIVVAMAVPLRSAAWWASSGASAPAPIRGVLYVDFRSPWKQVGDLHREFLEAAAVLVASVLEQREKLEVAREDLRAARAHVDVGDGPALDELLRPPSMTAIRREVASCLRGDTPVLVLGETGTGKTRFATAFAEASGREPVVRATLGSSDDLNTITSELFGHERGAYSGAVTKRVGLVELATGGTLVFDEILNLPPHAQQLLLDFTQFGTYRPLGWAEREPKRARLRIVAATNGDLERAIREGRFREDLYHRLATVVLTMPALRDRRDEIPAIAEAFLARLDRARRWRLAVGARRLLVADRHAWRGNVRELEGMLRRARERALADDPRAEVLRAEHLDPRDATAAASTGTGTSTTTSSRPRSAPERPDDAPLCAEIEVRAEAPEAAWAAIAREREHLDGLEKRAIELALERHGGVISRAARMLGVRRTSLLSRMDTLGVQGRAR